MLVLIIRVLTELLAKQAELVTYANVDFIILVLIVRHVKLSYLNETLIFILFIIIIIKIRMLVQIIHV
jgi:hypothetical protein